MQTPDQTFQTLKQYQPNEARYKTQAQRESVPTIKASSQSMGH